MQGEWRVRARLRKEHTGLPSQVGACSWDLGAQAPSLAPASLKSLWRSSEPNVTLPGTTNWLLPTQAPEVKKRKNQTPLNSTSTRRPGERCLSRKKEGNAPGTSAYKPQGSSGDKGTAMDRQTDEQVALTQHTQCTAQLTTVT